MPFQITIYFWLERVHLKQLTKFLKNTIFRNFRFSRYSYFPYPLTWQICYFLILFPKRTSVRPFYWVNSSNMSRLWVLTSQHSHKSILFKFEIILPPSTIYFLHQLYLMWCDVMWAWFRRTEQKNFTNKMGYLSLRSLQRNPPRRYCDNAAALGKSYKITVHG